MKRTGRTSPSTRQLSHGSNRSPDCHCARRGKGSCEIIEMHSSSQLWGTSRFSEFSADFGGGPRNTRKRKRLSHRLPTKPRKPPRTDRKAPPRPCMRPHLFHYTSPPTHSKPTVFPSAPPHPS